MRANTTPIPALAKNIRQKRLRARSMASPRPTCSNSSPDEFGITVVVRTMEIASFRILSPNTSMFSTGSMSNAWKIAIVATGSTAGRFVWSNIRCCDLWPSSFNYSPEISDPKAKLSMKLSWYATSAMPRRYTPLPITRALIAVPKIANTQMDPMFWKKFPLCKLYPDWKERILIIEVKEWQWKLYLKDNWWQKNQEERGGRKNLLPFKHWLDRREVQESSNAGAEANGDNRFR